jgi:hypothetical protein
MTQLIEGRASVRAAADKVAQEFDKTAETIRCLFNRMLSRVVSRYLALSHVMTHKHIFVFICLYANNYLYI